MAVWHHGSPGIGITFPTTDSRGSDLLVIDGRRIDVYADLSLEVICELGFDGDTFIEALRISRAGTPARIPVYLPQTDSQHFVLLERIYRHGRLAITVRALPVGGRSFLKSDLLMVLSPRKANEIIDQYDQLHSAP